MRGRTAPVRLVSIVLGCGDVGSAVAIALHAADLAVVLVDEADPAWHRRGMALTNAWYVGNAELDGIGACFCASLKSIPSVLAQRMIAATTWSWPGVAGALAPTIIVDARERHHRAPEALRGRVPLTIGIGGDFAPGVDVDVAIDLGELAARDARSCEPEQFDRTSAGHDEPRTFVVEAWRHGRFTTERRIGDSVRRGETVGYVGNEPIAAPATGVVLGLSARGARVEPQDRLVEVDPAGVLHRCYGVSARQRLIAGRVLRSIQGPQPPVQEAIALGESPDAHEVAALLRGTHSAPEANGAQHR